MDIKAGVDISRLKKPIRSALNTVQKVLGNFVVTSTYDGNHSPGSLHYAHLAFDIRNRNIEKRFVSDLKKELGSNFDVIDEGNHIHIEYDPKE